MSDERRVYFFNGDFESYVKDVPPSFYDPLPLAARLAKVANTKIQPVLDKLAQLEKEHQPLLDENARLRSLLERTRNLLGGAFFQVRAHHNSANDLFKDIDAALNIEKVNSGEAEK
jgi:hypothetical protein